MRGKAGVFMTGLLLGALSGGATALFSVAYLKHGASAHRQNRAERLPTQATKTLDRDQEEEPELDVGVQGRVGEEQ